jgi:hypothetical protein
MGYGISKFGRENTVTNALAWTPPIGHADDAHWVVPALLRSAPIEGRMLEPAAGRGHLSLELRRAGLEAVTRILLFPTSDSAISTG